AACLGFRRQLGARPVILTQNGPVGDGRRCDRTIDLSANPGILVEQHGRKTGASGQRGRSKAGRPTADHGEVVGGGEVRSVHLRCALSYSSPQSGEVARSAGGLMLFRRGPMTPPPATRAPPPLRWGGK